MEVFETFASETAPGTQSLLSRRTIWRECLTELGMSRPTLRSRGVVAFPKKLQNLRRSGNRCQWQPDLGDRSLSHRFPNEEPGQPERAL
jgi:hypothetical protein